MAVGVGVDYGVEEALCGFGRTKGAGKRAEEAHSLFDGIFDGGDDQITLDDNRLTRIIEAVAEVVPGQSTVQGTLIAESEEDDSPSASAETIAPEALLEKGMSFLGSLARTLRSPEATKRLLDTIVHLCIGCRFREGSRLLGIKN